MYSGVSTSADCLQTSTSLNGLILKRQRNKLFPFDFASSKRETDSEHTAKQEIVDFWMFLRDVWPKHS